MKLKAAMMVLSAAASCAFGAIKDTEWCVIETPDTAYPGQVIEVKVTLKEGAVPPGLKVSNHLQWMRKEGFGGMLSWVPGKDAVPGKTVVFKHKPSNFNEKISSISPLVFLSPNDDFKSMTKRANGSNILFSKSAEDAKKAESRIRPSTVTFKKSSLRIDPITKEAGQGDAVKVAVHYDLSPEDNWGDGTKITLTPLGPWIDNPDGKYTKSRVHIGVKGLGSRTVSVEPGKGTKVFEFKLGKPHKYNDLTWMAYYTGGDGKKWPWSVRGGSLDFKVVPDAFDLAAMAPGGVFTYDEVPRINIVWGKKAKRGGEYEISFKFTDSDGKSAGASVRTVSVPADGSETELEFPEIKARGVILVEGSIEGLGTGDAVIARIPNLEKRIGQARTPFGVTNVSTPEESAVARKLGMTYCRHFVNWCDLEPLEGQWMLDKLNGSINANNEAGLVPWICLVKPPSWVLPGDTHGAGFEPFPFCRDKWENTARHLAETFKGRIWGFEWLNEIVPGNKSLVPEEDYIDFCRIGTEAVKSVDSALKVQLAGGLWPRNFRTDLLAKGVVEYIDVLPVHYSDRTGVQEAIRDAAAAGKSRLEIWDNESARGLSVWGMPEAEALTGSVVQSKWVMRNWPAELAAGARCIVYFGGNAQAAGNWTYLRDAATPRPVAATLAVLSDKIGLARPVGTTAVNENTIMHLFEENGRGIAVASTISSNDGDKAVLSFNAGTGSVVVTDYKGESKTVKTENGVLTMEVGAMPVFIEGFRLADAAVMASVWLNGQDIASYNPMAAAASNVDTDIPVCVKNTLAEPVSGSVRVNVNGTDLGSVQKFSLKPGEDAFFKFAYKPGAEEGIIEASVCMEWDSPEKVSAEKAFRLVQIRADKLGNLLENGNMEEGVSGKSPKGWNSKTAKIVEIGGKGPGMEGHAMEFSKSDGWQHAMQSIEIPVPGKSYLYTAWVWNDNMSAGSNLMVTDDKGATKSYYTPHVFSAPQNTGFWRLMTHRRSVGENIRRMSFQPVAKGEGRSLYDNIRVTMYEGTDYAAEAAERKTDIVIDGDLSDWKFSEPIPLLCDNQISAENGYVWTPENLSGMAEFVWDDKALYLAVMVKDDVHDARTTGDKTAEGDSLRVAFHPMNRAEGEDGKAFEWIIGAAAPGGGSGRHTLYRPESRSGGLRSGHLARDSSVYEVAVKRDGDITCYEVRIPWSETGLSGATIGTKAGLSMQLIDSDGTSARGVMTWGGGLRPNWSPSLFGVLTLAP